VLQIILFQDNSDVLPHRSRCGNQQAPYSPDFIPAIYLFYVPYAEYCLQRKKISRHQGQPKLLTTKITAVASEVFDVCMQLLKRCKQCVAVKCEE
jgi:hypothetical protein